MSVQEIRQVEIDVLDEEYKRYYLIRLSEDLAITRLLKMKGDITRGLNVTGFDGVGIQSLHGFVNLLSRGLSHCLRWVCTDCPLGKAIHGPEWMEQDDQAADLLHWGMQYAQLATQHVAWSNSLIDATIIPSPLEKRLK